MKSILLIPAFFSSERTLRTTVRMIKPVLFFAIALFAAVPFSSPVFCQDEDEEEFTQTAPSSVQDDVEKAVAAFNAGQDAHAEGDLSKAMENYLEALRLLPEFPEAEYQIGTIHQSRGNLKDAEESFRRAISLRPAWTLPSSALGSLLVRKGEFAEAKMVLLNTLERDGNCIPCYPPLTEVYLQTDEEPEILRKHLQRLTILTSKSRIPASIWAAKAAVERSIGEITAAKESVSRALSLDPESTPALSEQIEILLALKDFEAAAAKAGRLVEKEPESVPAKIQLARAEHAAGRSQNAISILEPISAGSDAASGMIAMIKLDMGSDPGPLIELLKEKPGDPAVLGKLCSVTRKSDPESSLQYCLSASEAEPTNIDHAIGYGAALLQLKRYADAANLFSRLKENFGDNYTVRVNFAFALFQLERFDLAREEYLWITERQPELAAGHYFLAIANDRLERYTEALSSYQRFLKLAAKDKEQFADEISRVELRLPILERQVDSGKRRN